MPSRSPHAILLISCPDRKGLVARISDFVFRNHGNILHADEHIDDEVGLFLMRIEWDLAGFNLARDAIQDALQPLAQELAFDWQLHFSDERPRTAIFVSKYDHCLQDLLYRHRAGELAADFSLVVSNHPDLRDQVESQGLEYLVFPVTAESKNGQEKTVRAELDGGPIISQDAVRISHRDSVQDLIRKGRDLERVVLAQAVRAHLERRVLFYSNKTAVFD